MQVQKSGGMRVLPRRAVASRALACAACALFFVSVPSRPHLPVTAWVAPRSSASCRLLRSTLAAQSGEGGSLYDMATKAQKKSKVGKKKKAKKPSAPTAQTDKASKSESKPLPKKAGDSWLAPQGLCVAGAFLPIEFPLEQNLQMIVTSPGPSVAIGALTMVAGFLLGLVSLGMVTEALEQKNGRIVTGGPFSIVRHPTYTGFLLMTTGAALIALSPVRAALTVALAIVLSLKLGDEEEALLESRKEEWTEYCKKVPSKIVPVLY